MLVKIAVTVIGKVTVAVIVIIILVAVPVILEWKCLFIDSLSTDPEIIRR